MELNPLIQINVYVIISVIVTFVLTLLAMRRVFYNEYIRAIQEREKRIGAARVLRDEATHILADADDAAAAILQGAQGKAEGILLAAREKAEHERAAQLATAQADVSRYLKDQRVAIQTERESELAKLRTETVECVGLACDKLLGDTPPATVQAIVDRLITKRLRQGA